MTTNLAVLPTASNDDTNPGPRAEFRAADVTVRFMLAGDAHVTFQSMKTDVRFTFHIEAAPSRPETSELGRRAQVTHFVKVLTGPDSYEYLGCIYTDLIYVHGRKSRISPTSKSNMAFAWVWKNLTGGHMPSSLGVWHEGRCGACGRRLTTPESIESGLGPVCAKKGGSR